MVLAKAPLDTAFMIRLVNSRKFVSASFAFAVIAATTLRSAVLTVFLVVVLRAVFRKV